MCLAAAYGGNMEEAQEWLAEVKETFPDMEVTMDPISLSVACHIGSGIIALTCSKKIV